jgi:hypothetical protein
MTSDAELELFRTSVNCAAVLENIAPGWKLDARQSTRNALKYRRGAGEILIVNHDGRGWWDPFSQDKGNVIDLVQRLNPGFKLGQVRRALRPFVGVAPTYPAALCRENGRGEVPPVAERWSRRPRLRQGATSWHYLTEMRALSAAIIDQAAAQDIVRDGPYGSAWFAHRQDGRVCHVEIRGPDYKGSLKGGRKTLFRFAPTQARPRRLAVAEAPINALSLAELEQRREDTLYVATGGGMGPGTIEALAAIIADLAASPDALVASATDADPGGDLYAEYQGELAAKAGVRFARLRPPGDLDWNDILKKGRGP